MSTPLNIDTDDVVRRYVAGEGPREICAAFGISKSSVRRILKKAGVLRTRQDAARNAFRTGTRGLKGPRRQTIRDDGYLVEQTADGQKRAHVIVAERALGKSLPPDAIVHHVNEKRSDNRPTNLVVCPDQSYHALLHRRQRALEESGNADFMKCRFCKTWDSPENLSIHKDGRHAIHRPCAVEAQRIHRAQKRKEH